MHTMHETFYWDGPGYYACGQRGDHLETRKVNELDATYDQASNAARRAGLGTAYKQEYIPDETEQLSVVNLPLQRLINEQMGQKAVAFKAMIEAGGFKVESGGLHHSLVVNVQTEAGRVEVLGLMSHITSIKPEVTNLGDRFCIVLKL